MEFETFLRDNFKRILNAITKLGIGILFGVVTRISITDTNLKLIGEKCLFVK